MRGGFCCGRRGLGHYPRDGLLSLFCGPGYVGHQLLKPSLNFSGDFLEIVSAAHVNEYALAVGPVCRRGQGQGGINRPAQEAGERPGAGLLRTMPNASVRQLVCCRCGFAPSELR